MSDNTTDPVQRQFADAIAMAMKTPGRPRTAYSQADRKAIAEQADRIRAGADRLSAIADTTPGPTGPEIIYTPPVGEGE